MFELCCGVGLSQFGLDSLLNVSTINLFVTCIHFDSNPYESQRSWIWVGASNWQFDLSYIYSPFWWHCFFRWWYPLNDIIYFFNNTIQYLIIDRTMMRLWYYMEFYDTKICVIIGSIDILLRKKIANKSVSMTYLLSLLTKQ